MTRLDYMRVAIAAIAGVVICWVYLWAWAVRDARKAGRRNQARKDHRYHYPAPRVDGKDRRR